jgi:RNA polymerase primary sigma factor
MTELEERLRADADLIQRIRKGGRDGAQARAAMVKKYTPLVYNVVRKYHSRYHNREDLVQEGFCGLLRAIDRFDPSRGVQFITFATFWIRAFAGRAITLGAKSHRVRVVISRGSAAALALWMESEGEEPSDEQIAKRLGVKSKTVEEARALMNAPSELSPKLVDPGERPDEVFFRESAVRSQKDALKKALSTLDPRSSEIIRRRYLKLDDDGRGHTLEEIGEDLGVSRERVRQLEARALGVIAESLQLEVFA